jgi:hypothetical protein
MMLSIGLVDRICIGIIWTHPLFERMRHLSIKKEIMITLLLLLAGLICFWLFFKSIDWFEKI